MSEESVASFAQILESLGGQPAQKEAPAVPGPKADSLSLSIQAAKAIKQPLARNSFVERAPIRPASDQQGNRVLLSSEGKSLADSTAMNTAWETAREKRDKGG